MAITYKDQYGFEFIGTPNEIGFQSGRLRFSNDDASPSDTSWQNQGAVLAGATVVAGAQAGTQALRMVGTGSSFHAGFLFNESLADYTVHLVFRVSHLSNVRDNDTEMLLGLPGFTNGEGGAIELWVNAQGNLVAFDNDVDQATGSGYVSAGDWHHLEVQVNNAAKTLKVRLNGELQFTHTCILAPVNSNRICLGSPSVSGNYHEFDNIVIYTSSADEYAGPLVVTDMSPTGTVANNSFTVEGAATLHEATDDIDSDDDTTYAEGSAVNSNFFLTGDMPTFDGELRVVQMWAEVRHTIGAKDVQLQYKVGGAANDVGVAEATNAAYTQITQRVEGLAVPVAGANQFQFGLNKDN